MVAISAISLAERDDFIIYGSQTLGTVNSTAFAKPFR